MKETGQEFIPEDHRETLFFLNTFLHAADFAYKENDSGMSTTEATQELKVEGQKE